MKKIIIGLITIAFMLSVVPVTAQDVEIPYGSISADVQLEMSNTITSGGVTTPTGMVGKTVVWELTTFDFPLDEILDQADAPVTVTGDLTGSELHVTWLREYGDAYYVQAGVALGEDITVNIDETELDIPAEFPTSILDFTIPAGIGGAFPIPLLYLENMTQLFEIMDDMDNNEEEEMGIGVGINQEYMDMDDMGDSMQYLAGFFPTSIVPPKIDIAASTDGVINLLEYLNSTFQMENGTFIYTTDLTSGLNVSATFSDGAGLNAITFTFNWDDSMDGLLTQFSVTGTGDMDGDETVEAWETINVVFEYVSGYTDAPVDLPVQTGDTGSYGFSTINIDYDVTGDWADFLSEVVGEDLTVQDMLDTYIDLIEGLEGDKLLEYDIGPIDGLFYGLNVDMQTIDVGIGEPEEPESPADGLVVVNGYDGQIYLNVSAMYRRMEVSSYDIDQNIDGSYTIHEWDDDIEDYIGIWTDYVFDWDAGPLDQFATALDITDFETDETEHSFTFNTSTSIGYYDDLVIVLPPINNPVGDFNIYIPMIFTQLSGGMNVNQEIFAEEEMTMNLFPIQNLIPGPARCDIFFTEKSMDAMNDMLQEEMVPLMSWFDTMLKEEMSTSMPGFLSDEFGMNMITEFNFDDVENTMSDHMFLSLTMAVEKNEENGLAKDIEMNARIDAEMYEDWTNIGVFDKVGISFSAELGTGGISEGNEPPGSTGDIEPESPVFSPGFEVIVALGAALTLPLIKRKVK